MIQILNYWQALNNEESMHALNEELAKDFPSDDAVLNGLKSSRGARLEGNAAEVYVRWPMLKDKRYVSWQSANYFKLNCTFQKKKYGLQ